MTGLDDIVNVSRIICTWGYDDEYQYKELADGVNRVRDFIHSERFNYDNAVTAAAKAAYLATLLRLGINDVAHYDNSTSNQESKLYPTVDRHLSRLRKSNVEAYFYWFEISRLLNNRTM